MPVYSTFDQESLDREYSPSSLIDNRDVYLEQYANLSKAARDRDPRACTLDLQYGESAEETLDLFMPEKRDGAPLHVFVHGGFWHLLSKNESSFAAPMFQDRGSYFAALNYTLAPNKSLTGIVEETRLALSWLYRNADHWGYDRERIFLSGHSAGAHLAMMMLVTDWQAFGLPQELVKGVCAIGGVFDLEPVRLCYVNDIVGMDEDEAKRMSPVRHEIVNRCPVIFAYGDNETNEFKRQSNDYARQLTDAGLTICCREIPDRNHFDIMLDLSNDQTWLSGEVLSQMGLA
ncbi:MAG: alpha/beta hydrolase [Woeseiaceae bacterium]|nr:alpha/beta hydrolase [Woeseiaceae bacterium]